MVNKPSHESQMVRDAIAVALRTSRTPMTASELVPLMPWQRDNNDWECRKYPHLAHVRNDHAHRTERHVTWHGYEALPASGQVYQHLTALERRGIVRRIPFSQGRRVYWELTNAGAAASEIAELERIVDLDNNTAAPASGARSRSKPPDIDWGAVVTQLSNFSDEEFFAGRSHLLTADTYRHATASRIAATSSVAEAEHLELLDVDIVNSRSMMLHTRRRMAVVVADLREVDKRDVAAAQLVTIFHQVSQIPAHERVLVVIAGPAATSQLEILIPAINNTAAPPSLLAFQDAVQAGLTVTQGRTHLAPDLSITGLGSARCAALHQCIAAAHIDVAQGVHHA